MILKIIFKPCRLIIPFILIVAGFPGPSGSQAEPVLYFAPQSFQWREFVDGERAVRESGPLFGLGITHRLSLDDRTAFVPRAELFFGSVDYEGHACDMLDNCEPANTTVDYLGLKLEGDLGRRIHLSREKFLEPFGGLGFRIWTRDLHSGTTASGELTSGYAEEWIMLQLRAGARGGILLSEGKQVFLQAGVIIPVYIENTAYVSEIGQGPDIRMHPGKQASFFAEAGLQSHSLTAVLFFDSLRFPQSSIETNGFVVAYQPRSTMDVYGLRVGWVF